MHHRVRRAGQAVALALSLVLLVAGCSGGHTPEPSKVDETRRVSLGRQLFFDTRLSADGKVSCATCHRPDHAFSDLRPRSIGVHSREGTRNAPSLLDVADHPHFFWDGRESALTTVVLQPFTNPVEMGLENAGALLDRIGATPGYRDTFASVFPTTGGLTADNAATALTTYLKSLRSGNSPYDRYRKGDSQALSMDAQAGLALFQGKATCHTCHRLDSGARFTDDGFHHLGVNDAVFAGQVATLIQRLEGQRAQLGRLVLSDKEIAGLGHFVASRKPADLGSFRTPSLRNVDRTAPYMHDGSVATLEDAVDQEIYYRGLNQGRPLSLTVEERQQLIAFLRALSDGGAAAVAPGANKPAGADKAQDGS